MTRWLRLVAASLTAVLALAPLAGCGGSGGDAVQLMVFGAPEELAAYRKLVAAYRKAAPGERVRLVEASDREDLIARLSTSIAGGSPPDITLLNYRYYGQFAAKNAFQPYDQRLAGSETLRAGDLYPEAMAAFWWGGKQLCLPQNVSSLVVYYNRELFRKYKIPEPKAGWSWNEMLAAATALTRDASGTVVNGTESEGTPRNPRCTGWAWSRAGSGSRRSSGRPAASWSTTPISRPGSPSTPRRRARRCGISSTCGRRTG